MNKVNITELKLITDKSQALRYINPKPEWISIKYIVDALCEEFNKELVAKRCAEKATPGTKYYGMTWEEIVQQWTTFSKSRIITGVTFDTYTQYKLSNTPIVIDDNVSDEQRLIFSNFDKLKETYIDREYRFSDSHIEQMKFLGSEIWLSSKLGFRGRMDAAFWFNGGFLIFDWKNYKQINNGYKQMLGPLSDLKDSDFNKATLQLYLYRYIIEHEYELPFNQTLIGVVNENFYHVQKPTFEYDYKLIEECIEFGKKESFRRRNITY